MFLENEFPTIVQSSYIFISPDIATMIHKRSDLNQAQRDVVQRKQFSNLPYDDSIIFGRIQKEFEDRNFTVEEHAKDPDQDHHEFKLDQRVSKNDTIDFGWRQLGVMVPSLNPDDYAQRKTIDVSTRFFKSLLPCMQVARPQSWLVLRLPRQRD